MKHISELMISPTPWTYEHGGLYGNNEESLFLNDDEIPQNVAMLTNAPTLYDCLYEAILEIRKITRAHSEPAPTNYCKWVDALKSAAGER